EAQRFFQCLTDALAGRIEASDLPPVLSQEDRISPLSHSDVQSPARLSMTHSLNQKVVRISRKHFACVTTVNRVVLVRLRACDNGNQNSQIWVPHIGQSINTVRCAAPL